MTLLDQYKSDLILRGLSQKTIVSNLARVRAYLIWAETSNLDPVQAAREDFLAYLQSRREAGVKRGTLKGDFSALVGFYELLEEQGKSRSAGDLKAVQKKYMRSFKPDAGERQIISIEEMAQMVSATISTRDRTILLLLAKTGMRCGELASLDLVDVNIENMSIRLKPTAKRTNRIVFYDDEAADSLCAWLRARGRRNDGPGLFYSTRGGKLGQKGIQDAVIKAAARVGLHDPDGPLEERFGPHCCRHWFTTHLLRARMERSYVQWLRGDAIREAVDIYYHIDSEDVRRSYLVHVPRLGI